MTGIARWTSESWPLVATLMLSLVATAASAQDLSNWTLPQLTVVHWVLFVGVFAAIWIVLYFILYPYFLRFFSPEYSKVIFWSLFLFYAMTWLHLSSYLIFDIGFYIAWTRWLAAVLTGLWVLWFVAVMIRGRRA